MSAIELASQMRSFLVQAGSVDAKVVEKAEIPLHYGLTMHAGAAVDCKDKRLTELFETDPKFESLALGNQDCFGVPYGPHLILIFETEDDNEGLQVWPSSLAGLQTKKSQVAAVQPLY